MHAALVAIVFGVWMQMSIMYTKQPDAKEIADAIASAVESEDVPASGESHAVDAALLAWYAGKESGVSKSPTPTSWDARAGLSEGVWQLRFYLVRGHSLKLQAQTWLSSMKIAGLGRGVDSSPSRAAYRLSKAREALSAVLADEGQIAVVPGS